MQDSDARYKMSGNIGKTILSENPKDPGKHLSFSATLCLEYLKYLKQTEHRMRNLLFYIVISEAVVFVITKFDL